MNLQQTVAVGRRMTRAVVAAVIASSACARPARDRDGDPSKFISVMRSADRVVVWEGLPHDLFERGLFERERANPVHELFGFAFYPTPLSLDAAEVARLSRLLGEPATFEPFAGAKPCGGFHPDDAIEVRAGAAVCYALLCFGCGEVELHCDNFQARFEDRETWTLANLLLSHRTSRPDSTYFESVFDTARAGPAGPVASTNSSAPMPSK